MNQITRRIAVSVAGAGLVLGAGAAPALAGPGDAVVRAEHVADDLDKFEEQYERAAEQSAEEARERAGGLGARMGGGVPGGSYGGGAPESGLGWE